MKKIGKFLLTIAIIGCVSSSVLQIGFVSKLKDDLVELGKQGVHYFISLNRRIKELEEAQGDIPVMDKEVENAGEANDDKPVMGEDVEDNTQEVDTPTTDTMPETITAPPTCDTTAQEPQETTSPTMSNRPQKRQ